MTPARKAASIFFLVFFAFVLLDWAFVGVKNFLGAKDANWFPQLVPIESNGLATVDFTFFSKKESRNYISQGYGVTSFSLFNDYTGHRHNGIDIVAKYGAPVLSASEGKVVAAGNQDDYCWRRGFGKFIAVKSVANNLVMFYAHLSSIKEKFGASVAKGDTVGAVGNTGFATAPHLHFSIFEADGFQMKSKNGCGPGPDGRDLNPLKYLPTLQ